MDLQDIDLKTMLAQIGRASPSISGSTAALVAGQLGIAMARMAFEVSHKRGSDTELVTERLDFLLAQIKKATEDDRVASMALIEAYHQNSSAADRKSVLIDATRAPLAAAHLLVELLELLDGDASKVASDVASDFDGGVELISAAFAAVMMAVESNLRDDDAQLIRARTQSSQSSLSVRAERTIQRLRQDRSK
ncbi:cyclodeaminase/cyclohydrolase family protein [Neorhizobium alkalisoli]|uniref:Formiminotetrahydrofolate cyclodeaminase n=1 Tax=Neorhizobium alkalisoli TaxID=528178 RepID=A0A561PVS3_9HYPH|nr:cyclodeaminase/cyclohydrolase family protein [Neorhizobium alkalisoli]TWF42226.1 formiminotetrahydrofolate cyclodeaminase [Neorhizobium alkalisoli]